MNYLQFDVIFPISLSIRTVCLLEMLPKPKKRDEIEKDIKTRIKNVKRAEKF